MKGKYRIIVENKNVRYDFEIRRNITIIKGDSATGKTTLVDMISEYEDDGEESGIHLVCDVPCHVIDRKNWKNNIQSYNNSIIFIDEGNKFISSIEFAETVKGSDNYFVIVTRESLEALPYSIDEIYGIRNSGKYGSLKQIYNEMYKIYTHTLLENKIKPKLIIVEDSKSGYQFFSSVINDKKTACISADGKSNIYKCLKNNADKFESILVIADGAAFGSECDKVMTYVNDKNWCHVYLPESFEWLILKSGIIKDSQLKDILEQPYSYIDSIKYVSWERFFTALLIEKAAGTYLEYSKSKLNDAYVNGIVKERVLETMRGINLI